jgi:ABC-2 type transport system permease protein
VSALSRVRQQVGWEQKAFWRNPPAAVFTFAFPLIFLVIFMAINRNDRVVIGGGEVRFAQFYVPAIIAFGVISACYTAVAFTLCLRRELGILKRVRGTPLRPGEYLAGVFGSSLVVALVLTVLVTLLGVVFYGVTVPNRYPAFVLTIAVGAACFVALGTAVSTLVPNEDAAPAIINAVLFPLLFISGTFGPIEDGSFIDRIAGVFPIQHFNRAIESVFDPGISGNGVRGGNLAVMVAWAVGAAAFSKLRFRWEPQRT